MTLQRHALLFNTQCFLAMTYIGGLLVVIDMMNVSSKAEVCYLHDVIFRYQDITGSQVSMNTLKSKHTLFKGTVQTNT